MVAKDKTKRSAYSRRSRYRRMTLAQLQALRRSKTRHLPDIDAIIEEKGRNNEQD